MLKKSIILMAVIAFLGISGCKRRRTDADMTTVELGRIRDQGRNGSCWLYSFGTALNATLTRANIRMTMVKTGLNVGDPFGFMMVNAEGSPWTVDDYYQHYVTYRGIFPQALLQDIGELQNRNSSQRLSTSVSLDGMILRRIVARLQSGIGYGDFKDIVHYAIANAPYKQTPLISINGLIYGSYISRFDSWLKSQGRDAYKKDGGTAFALNELYPKALFPNDLFPDKDATTADAEVGRLVCAKKPGNCDPGSISDIIVASEIFDKPPIEKKNFFNSAIDTPFSVPDKFRVTTRDNAVYFPVIYDDFKFEFGGKNYNKASIADVFHLPRDIHLVSWFQNPKEHKDEILKILFRNYWNFDKIPLPNGHAMSEIVAGLTLLNQPVTVSINMKTKTETDGEYWLSSTDLPDHAVVSQDFMMRNGELGIVVRNSYGYDQPTMRLFGLKSSFWIVDMPGFLLARVAAIFNKAVDKNCNAADMDVRALGAAYLFLRDHEGYKDFSTQGNALLAYLKQCNLAVTGSF